MTVRELAVGRGSSRLVANDVQEQLDEFGLAGRPLAGNLSTCVRTRQSLRLQLEEVTHRHRSRGDEVSEGPNARLVLYV